MKSLQYNMIPVVLVKNFLWCSTYTWLSWNGPTPALPPHSQPPRENMHPLEATTLLEALGHRGHLISEAELEDPILGLRGRVDYLAEPEPPPGAIIEYKPRGVWGNGDIELVQTALYTIMAENVYNKPFKGYLVTATDVIEVEERHKAKALSTLAMVKRILNDPQIPRPTHNLSRCKSCVYRRICPYYSHSLPSV
ncbi:MAG: PD-(D/E)XK nuclease family protein [Desulfurococcales archaeon]|nr:PD-(D/E)XK nuclease family protein [Desulfurococcales archaeon]